MCSRYWKRGRSYSFRRELSDRETAVKKVEIVPLGSDRS